MILYMHQPNSKYMMFDSSTLEKIDMVHSKMTDISEMEIKFKTQRNEQPSIVEGKLIIAFMKKMSDMYGYPIIKTITCDIHNNSTEEQNTMYRVSLKGETVINTFIDSNSEISDIFYNAVSFAKVHTQHSEIIKKRRVFHENIKDYGIVLTLSDEEHIVDIEGLENKIDNNLTNGLNIRYKSRMSMVIKEKKNDGYDMRLDFTTVQDITNMSMNIPPNYEIELELTNVTDTKKTEMMENFIGFYEKITKTFQQNNVIVPPHKADKIINEYKIAMSSNSPKLQIRNPESIKIHTFLDTIPHNYSVSDKSDGKRTNIIISDDGGIHIIDTQMNVKWSGYKLQSEKLIEKYAGSILDSETIYVGGKYIHLIFDCMKVGRENIMDRASHLSRLEEATGILSKCTKYKFSPKNPNTVESFEEFIKHIIAELKAPTMHIFAVKQFIPCKGKDKHEVYENAYNLDKKIKNIQMPYETDGLIMHPMYQTYELARAKSIYKELKVKPPEINSIDFYIEFKKNSEGMIYFVFDNTDEDSSNNTLYAICQLFVGRTVMLKNRQKREEPTPFILEDGTNEIKIAIDDKGNIIGQNGDMMFDKTVWEFNYDSVQKTMIPMRPRDDKTYHVQRYKEKYGNAEIIAQDVWTSIKYPVLMDHFKGMINEKTSDKTYKYLKKQIIEISESKITVQSSPYHSGDNKISDTMNKFHGFVKSNLIYNVCSDPNGSKRYTILDLACGRANDIEKYYMVSASHVVLIDIDYASLFSTTDSRSAQNKRASIRRKVNAPKITIIQADLGKKLNASDQMKVINSKDSQPGNFEILSATIGKVKYDRLICNFAIHYALKDKESWENFKYNVSSNIKDGGYFIITTFNGDYIRNLIGKNESYAQFYTDENGVKTKLFEMVKGYSDKKNNIGDMISFNATWLFGDKYVPEYLVYPEFLIDEMTGLDMQLVDIGEFYDHYLSQEDFIKNYSKYDIKLQTIGYLDKVMKYYDKTNLNEGLLEHTKTAFYAVFRKNKVYEKISEIKGGKKLPDQTLRISKNKCNTGYTFIECIITALEMDMTPNEFIDNYMDNIDTNDETLDPKKILTKFNVIKNIGCVILSDGNARKVIKCTKLSPDNYIYLYHAQDDDEYRLVTRGKLLYSNLQI